MKNIYNHIEKVYEINYNVLVQIYLGGFKFEP